MTPPKNVLLTAVNLFARWGSGSGEIDELRMDKSTNSLQIVDYEHHEVHAGSHFFIDDVADLAINNVFDMQFTTPDTAKWGHFTFTLNSEAEVEWYVYEGASITTPGTPYTPNNNNRNSENASVMTVGIAESASLAAANAITDVTGAKQLRHGIIGAGKQNAGTDERGKEVVLKQNTTYVFRAIANAAGYVNFDLNWYEHTDKN